MDLALLSGSNIDLEDDEGKTPLELAIQEKRRDAIVWLLRNSATTARITANDVLATYENMEYEIDTVKNPYIVRLCREKSASMELYCLLPTT